MTRSVSSLRVSIVVTAALLLAVHTAKASVNISADATANMSCSAGVCSPTAKQAILNATDLANMLAGGDVKVTTGAGAVTIEVTSGFSWTSLHRLTLDAAFDVSFKAPVVVAGTGAVTIVTSDGESGGDLFFFPGGTLDFWDTSSSLIVNGTQYLLAKDLTDLANLVGGNASGAYALVSDYDAASDVRRRPLPEFRGEFDGLGHTVSNLRATAEKDPLRGFDRYGGLFGYTNAQLANLILLHENVVGGGPGRAGAHHNEYLGGLAGYVDTAGKISNVRISGQIGSLKGRAREASVGGVVGYNTGLIVHAYVDAKVLGSDGCTAGGIAGQNILGTIELSYSSGLSACDFAGAPGGIAGGNVGVIDRCFSTMRVAGTPHTVEASAYSGGLVGENGGTISNSYATGEIEAAPQGSSVNGGLVGFNDEGNIANSYSIGEVWGASYTGASVGLQRPGTPSDVYWDLDTSNINDPSRGCGNIANCAGITGLTDLQLKSGLPAGFDPAIWGHKLSINNGYPYLLANPPPQ